MFISNDAAKISELKHDCDLQIEDDDLIDSIYTGGFVDTRRYIRKRLLVSRTHPKSRYYFKSSFTIKLEIKRHLRENYWTIHPLSDVTLGRERFMMFVYIFYFLMIPVYVMWWDLSLLEFLKFYVDLICIVDVIFDLNTGYINYTSNRIILKRKQIIKKKILPSIVFDILSSINIGLLVLINPQIDEKTMESWTYTVILKYGRLFTFLRYVDDFFEFKQCNGHVVKILKLVLLSIVTTTWSACVVYIVTAYNSFSESTYGITKSNYILLCFQEAIYSLLLFGVSPKMERFAYSVAQIAFLTIGLIIRLVIISQVVQILTKVYNSNNKSYEISQQLEQFMRFKSLPNGLRKRIRAYFEFRFQEDYYKEAAIMEMITPQMHEEMLLHTHIHLLEKSTIFFDLPREIMSKIVLYLKPEIYLPSDVIVTAGTQGDAMFFIASGTVAVYTPAGKELCHLTDGASFGELSMVMENEYRIANVIAIDNCELFLLHRKDYLRQVENYPDLLERISNLAQEQVRKTLIGSVYNDDSSERISHAEIRVSTISYIRV